MSEIVSVPRETSELSKAIVAIPESQSSRENYVQHLLAAKELYIFAAPKMIETMKNQFHKSRGGLYFKQHQHHKNLPWYLSHILNHQFLFYIFPVPFPMYSK